MLAVEVTGAGGPEVLHAVQRPRPVAGSHQVVIAVEAVGVNFVDLQHRAGHPYPPIPTPFVPGIEAAGTVESVGDRVTEFAVGDLVAFAGPMPGAYAELVIIDADLVVPVPDPLDAYSVATILMQGLTAHYLTHDAHPVQSGEWVFVHAAGSGVGRLVAAYARSMGGHVIGGSTRTSKLEQILANGADAAVDITEPGLAVRTRELSNGGCAAVYDSVGGRYLEENLRCLRERGDLVIYGMSDGPMAPFDLARLSGFYDAELHGSLRVSWTTLSSHVATRQGLRARAHAVLEDAISGVLPLPQTVSFDLTDAAQAHAWLSTHAGQKVLLRPRRTP